MSTLKTMWKITKVVFTIMVICWLLAPPTRAEPDYYRPRSYDYDRSGRGTYRDYEGQSTRERNRFNWSYYYYYGEKRGRQDRTPSRTYHRDRSY